MKKRSILRMLGVLTLCTLVLAVGLPAAAQGGGTLNPADLQNQQQQAQSLANAAPQPRLTKYYPTWVGYLVMFLMVATIIPLSLMPSKRSHQD